MPRTLIYVLIFAVWVIFTAGVIIYQDRDGQTAGEHPESDADQPPSEPQLSAAA
jgi:hypothetical protein